MSSMSSPFPFIPRKVAKHVHHQESSSPRSRSHDAPVPPAERTTDVTRATDEPKSQNKGKAKATEEDESSSAKKFRYTDQDYAVLVSMALSDYALWIVPELRRKLEHKHRDGETSADESFISLSYLMQHSPILSHSELSETAVAKALRAVASEDFEIRMIVSETTLSTWKLKKIEALGLYEIRRKDWTTPHRRTRANYSQVDWEKRTIYVENIPPQYRAIPQIAHFIQCLCRHDSSPAHRLQQVQNVALLPSHLDKPGDQPRSKGFALVVLSELDDIDRMLSEWPWDRSQSHGEALDSEAGREAVRFGFRTLCKRRWRKLQDEYLAYRRKLLASEHPPLETPSVETNTAKRMKSPSPSRNDLSLVPEPVYADHLQSYPTGCLIFVRNVHPETNKTTLRAMFSGAFGATSTSPEDQLSNDGIDYVDFSKGMDSCHIRLKTPNHSRALVEYFSTCPTVQSRGLDDAGKILEPPANATHAIKMELVQGKREEMYWEKVPEKVRQQALQRAAGLEPDLAGADHSKSNADMIRPTRKRRKH